MSEFLKPPSNGQESHPPIRTGQTVELSTASPRVPQPESALHILRGGTTVETITPNGGKRSEFDSAFKTKKAPRGGQRVAA